MGSRFFLDLECGVLNSDSVEVVGKAKSKSGENSENSTDHNTCSCSIIRVAFIHVTREGRHEGADHSINGDEEDDNEDAVVVEYVSVDKNECAGALHILFLEPFTPEECTDQSWSEVQKTNDDEYGKSAIHEVQEGLEVHEWVEYVQDSQDFHTAFDIEAAAACGFFRRHFFERF